MTTSLEGWPTKAKEGLSPHEIRLAPLDTKPVFQSLRGKFSFNQPKIGCETGWCDSTSTHYMATHLYHFFHTSFSNYSFGLIKILAWNGLYQLININFDGLISLWIGCYGPQSINIGLAGLNTKKHQLICFFKSLWLHFRNGVQLSQVYRATTRRNFTFNHSVPKSSWYLFAQHLRGKKAVKHL